MIRCELVGDRQLVARLTSMPAKLRDALTRKVTILALKLEDRVKRKLTNDVLHVRSGALRRSIQHGVESDAASVSGEVYSTGDVKYAGIHEFGGRTKAHIIEAKNAKALAFELGGKQVFLRRVNHPGSNMPERSYLRSSLREMTPEITAGLEQTVIETLGS